MKKLYAAILVALIFLSLPGFSQVVVNQGFESGGAIPSGWTATIISGSYNWVCYTAAPSPPYPTAHGGSYFVNFNSWNASGGSNAVLITPVIDWGARGGVATSCTVWVWRDATYCSGVGDLVQVYVNTASNLTGATSLGIVPRWAGSAISGGAVGTSAPGVNGWYQYTFPIPTTFNGATNYILIKGQSSFGAGSNIDDVSYTAYPCTPPVGGAISNNAPVCVGSVRTLTNPTGTAGGSWSSSNTAIATVSGTGDVTGVAPGTATITYSVSACSITATATAVVTVNAVPTAISGTLIACPGNTSALTNGVAGGSWTSATPAVATINSSTGVVTAVTAGTANITYNLGNGCATANANFTVNPTPSAITGSALVCVGSNTTLSSATSGGAWSSNNTGVATVSAGVVTGVSGGSPIISYTMPTGIGCFVTQAVTVNANSPITGGTSVCNGYSILLSNATSGGGTWSSSSTSVATITSGGLLTSVSIGATTISFTATSTGCVSTSVVNVTAPPSSFTVTGGGSFCAVSGGGAVVGLNSSNVGVTYSLFSGATLVATFTGTGSSFNFPGLYPAGSYNVVANYGSPCANNMLGTAVITANPLPTAFVVTGGGSYCLGGTGVAVNLSSSTIGVNYQLFLGGTPVGSPVAGTGSAISFGSQTGVGTYTVVASNGTTGCTNNMTGSVAVSTNALPPAFAVTSGASGYCVGGIGVPVGLSSSTIGVNYQLLVGGAAVGSVVAGTGTTITFGNQTTTGTYTVLATNATTGCTSLMSGSIAIGLNPLPNAYTVVLVGSTTGAYCFGGTGVTVGLNGSQTGVNYQLYNGSTPVGAPVAGTGVAINFGLQTVVGSYSVIATNATTTCSNNMTGSVAITTNPLPSVFGVTGGGSYCAGGTGVAVGLAASNSGVNYQLFNGGTLIGAASGTGLAVSFGLQTLAGTYSVVATNSTTGCTANMSGSATVSINALPTVFNVSNSGATSFCQGGTGVAINLSGSTSGVNYRLMNGSSLDTTIPGTGLTLNFLNRINSGAYSVIAVNATTGCTSNMTGSALITINPLPTVFTMTGGGGYCAGTSGIAIGLAGSNTGINYQLYNLGGAVGTPVAGTGTAISFGLQTAISARDSVVATNAGTGCTAVMAGNVPVFVNPLPTLYSVIGGGAYCAGGSGLNINLGGSASGISYQLMNGTTLVGAPIVGTGSPLVFGPITAAGTYNVVATNPATSCSSNMGGSATITINALPTVISVTGGGAYCSGAAGVRIGLATSVSGNNYQVFNGTVAASALIPGTGVLIDFGPFTAAGTYTVIASSPVTFCQSTMSGSAVVSINPLPTVYTITQSATNFCSGGAGVHIGLSNSSVGFAYQLMNLGVPVGAPALGTGLPLDYGLITANGNYTIVATNSSTGCTANMTGVASVVVNPLPAVQTVIGGGDYCPGGTGVTVGLGSSAAGISYQLYNGPTAVGSPVAGVAGLPVTFGLQTVQGTYTVVAINTTTGCTRNMSGSAVVNISPVPTLYSVSGGGNYCVGGSGVNVMLSGSSTGVLYQLYDASAPMGAPMLGTGAALNFGPQTTLGSYTVVATSTSTTCSSTMFGSANVGTNPLPNAFTVTGGGNYCAGSGGSVIGLDGSAVGINYHMFMAGLPVGSTVAGTGAPISFGTQTAVGSYTIVATNTATTCTNTMTGAVTVDINALPGTFAVTGGGNYCAGAAGVAVMLASSDAAASYQLYRGTTPVGTLVAGTGGPLNLGMQTIAGNYTVKAIDNSNGCSVSMTGSVNVGITPLPTPFVISGGGNYCAGSTGVHVMLSGSNTGLSYEIFISGIPSGIIRTGTGSALDFGTVTTAGIYTIVGTNPTSMCTNNMIGSVNVGINPLPTMHTVVSTSSSYCAGGPGVEISVDGTDLGISYQLYYGTAPMGAAVDGTGSMVSMGYVTGTGSYKVVAKDVTTGCSVNFNPNISVNVNPLPAVFTVTGGGAYCSGEAGVHIGLSGSNAGINYQVYRAGGAAVGSPVTGTGSAIDLGVVTAAGSYVVMATNNASTCTNNMSGNAIVVVNPLPALYTVTGGGNYCATGSGVAVGLSGSTIGITYQLKRGAFNVGAAVSGTGSAISFGTQTSAGTYTIVAVNSVTGCSATMIGSTNIAINPLPTAYNTTGGGNYCPGGTGVMVGTSASNTGITYQLYNGAAAVGTGIGGVTGTSINFGLQTAAGTYTVVGTDNATGCATTMSGFAIVNINAEPGAYNVVGGGSYCAGGVGVHVGLANSASGVNYTIYGSLVSMGTMAGTGGPIDFGFETAAGNYTVIGTNTTTGCSKLMNGSADVNVIAPVTPIVTVNSGGGDTTCSGTLTTFTAITSNGGSAPSYTWTINGVVTGVGSSYSYIPVNGDIVGVTLTSNQNCAMPSTAFNSKEMVVEAKEFPTVTATADPGVQVCQGTTVNYSATSTFGGTAPVYTWVKNGVAISTSANFSYVPANGDNLYCVLTSNYRCRLANTASSSHMNMIVDVATPPAVTISANPGANVAYGQNVTLTANIVNGGTTPSIQWLVNGIAIPGANGTSFSSNSFANLDSITCQVLSSGGCSGLLGFNSITIHVANVGVNPVSFSGSNVILVPNPNKGQFTIKGSIGSSDEAVTVEVVNMLGQVIYNKNISVNNGDINEQITLTNSLANGMYILNLRSGTENKAFHFVIEQ